MSEHDSGSDSEFEFTIEEASPLDDNYEEDDPFGLSIKLNATRTGEQREYMKPTVKYFEVPDDIWYMLCLFNCNSSSPSYENLLITMLLVKKGMVDVITLLIKNTIKTSNIDSFFMNKRTGLLKIVANDTRFRTDVFCYACTYGNINVIESFKMQNANTKGEGICFSVDPSMRRNHPICKASRHGHTDIVRMLLEDKRTDPSAYDNLSICQSSEYGYTNIVELLLKDPRVDPNVLDNYPLRKSNANKHFEVVKVLLRSGRINRQLEEVQTVIKSLQYSKQRQVCDI